MSAICHKCGSTKAAPFERCQSCHAAPASDDDLALALMLSDQFLSDENLAEASRIIKSGQRIELPPDTRAAVLAAIERARAERMAANSKKGLNLRWCAVIVGVVMVLFLIFHPWPHFQWASFQDTVASYESFVDRFPSGDYAKSARKRIWVMREPDVWSQAKSSGQIEAFRGYVRDYPDGQHLDEAKDRIAQLADAQWENVAGSRSEAEIREFLRSYPETTKTALAKARIQELFNDWDWVREQDSLEHYQRFAARFPLHPQKDWLEKRIIDLEVEQIAAGDYGEMPRAQPLRLGGVSARIEVENQTGYELTVRYSGPDSKKIVIPKGMTRTVSLPPGTYKVAASVNAFNVRNYYGTDEMRGGQYFSSFYIQTEYGGFALPRRRR